MYEVPTRASTIFDSHCISHDLDVADEIADNFDLMRGVRKFNAEEFFFDQYQQLQATEGIKVKIVTEVHFICN